MTDEKKMKDLLIKSEEALANATKEQQKIEEEVKRKQEESNADFEKELSEYFTKEEIKNLQKDKGVSPEEFIKNMKEFHKWKKQQEKIEITKEDILKMEKTLQKYEKQLQPLKQQFEYIEEQKNSIQEETFDIMNATKEQKEQYFEVLKSGRILTEDIYQSIFGKTTTGKKLVTISSGKELEEYIEKYYKGINPENIYIRDRDIDILDIPYEEWLKIETGEMKEIVIHEKRDYLFENIDKNRLLNVLEQQKHTNELLLECYQKASKLAGGLIKANQSFSPFAKIKNSTRQLEAKRMEVFERLNNDLLEAMKYDKEFGEFIQQKNPVYYTITELIEDIKAENTNIDILKDALETKQDDELYEYTPFATNNKLVAQEKVLPQLFVLGNKIKEKVTFDLTSDKGDEWIVNVIMEQYPIAFTTHTFKTLESLMTIQNSFQNEYSNSARRPFSTRDIIYLNRGGKVSKYTKEDITKTNREITSLMSAVGKFDITEYMKKYNEQRKDDEKIPMEQIKKISGIRNFAYMSGVEIELNKETGENEVNTMWYFMNNQPIPIFEFLKLTNRYTTLPLEMDSYLTENDINNEITRVLKSTIASLNYYKASKKRKQTAFQYYYFEGIEEGKNKEEIYKPEEAIKLLKEKKLFGKWKYITTRRIDTIAEECLAKDDNPWKKEGNLSNNERKAKTRFIDRIVEYLRKAKADNNIADFILYTEKEETINEEEYITEGQRKKDREIRKRKGTFEKDKRAKTKYNDKIYKIGIIIE